MRVVFMGTPSFAVPSLMALASRHEVTLVVTRPDRAAGRGTSLRHSAVKSAALEAGLPLLQPSTLRGDACERITAAASDVVCVAAFGMILPAEVLGIPRHGCINVHASLLPAYRGAAPVQRAVLAGDSVTGVSIMRMEQGLDTGAYAAQRTVPIDERYAEEIEHDIAVQGADALLEVLDALDTGSALWVEQDDSKATYAAKVMKDDVALLPELSVREAFARVRAATRRAPARACVGDRELTIVRAHPDPTVVLPGAVCVIDGLPHLGFEGGSLGLDVVRPAGKGDMGGEEWARGARLTEDTCWRCTR